MSDPMLLHHLTESCRKLDEEFGRDHMKCENEVDLSVAGQFEVALPEHIRSVSDIWFRNGTTLSLHEMHEVPEKRMLLVFPNLRDVTTGNQNVGCPGYWALAPQKWQNGLGLINQCNLIINEADVYINDEDSIRSVFIAPAVETEYAGGTLVVWGTAWTPRLRGYDDTNWWIENYPTAVGYTAMWRYDMLHRDQNSATAWLEAAKQSARKYHHSLVATANRSVTMQMGDQL